MNTMERMDDARQKTLAFAQGLSDDVLCAQPDEAFSPISWHLGHIAFTEALWALAQCGGDTSLTTPYAERYAQNGREKSSRAEGYERSELFDYLAQVRERVRDAWANVVGHELGAGGYLDWFLACHEHQHRETMQLVLACAASKRCASETNAIFRDAAVGAKPLHAKVAERRVFQGHGSVGSDSALAYDNERPSLEVQADDFALDERVISAGQWAAFMDDGGYDSSVHWCEEGWAFAQTLAQKMPRPWKRGGDGYVLLAPKETRALTSDEAVWGISWYEAEAYARWAGAQLPSEVEWELASRQGLTGTRDVWEWCACTFKERPGFAAHPYPGYSAPYFDEKHRVMRGGSFATDPLIARPGFRNWFAPETRQVFAGLRLRWPG